MAAVTTRMIPAAAAAAAAHPRGRALARLRAARADRGAARHVHRLSVRARHPAVGDRFARGRSRRVRRPRQLPQDLERLDLPHRRLQHVSLYGRDDGLQAGARAVARDAAEPPFPGQGAHPRVHPAAVHHSDRAVDLRLEVDVRSDLQRAQLAALSPRPDHRPHQLAGRPRPRDDLDHRGQHLARRAVLRDQPAGRTADHQPRAATRPPRSTAPSRGSASGT